jgi:hypothetical protein
MTRVRVWREWECLRPKFLLDKEGVTRYRT